MSELLPSVVVEPQGRAATGALIWLHGLGADGNDFVPILPHLPLVELGLRVTLPHAPSQPVTINGGFVMPSWYDIRDGDLSTRHDEAGIRVSARQVRAFVDAERARGVPAERIGVVGFSQGGAMALHVGLRYPEALAGVAALSTYLLLPELLDAERSEANAQLPIFMAHGTHDGVVAPSRSESARDQLRAAGYPLEWSSYPMGHEVHPQELSDLSAWLRARFGAA